MDTTGAIGKLGYRRWYERQLIEAHVWLAVCVLGMVGLFGGIESVDMKSSALTSAMGLLLAFGAGFLAWHALMRYIALMVEAQRYADASTCGQCKAEGRFRVLRKAPRIEVVCEACGHHWHID